MKKKRLIGVSLLSVALLTGCGGTPSPDIPGPDDTQNDENKTYSITLSETNGVTLTLSKNSAKAGENITILVDSVPENVIIESITTDIEGVDVSKKSENEYYFIMPKADVKLTVNVSIPLQDTYLLTVNNEVNVEIVALMNSQQNELYPNKDGKYELEPNASYFLRLLGGDETYAVRINDKRVSSSEGYYVFTMPAQDSTLHIVPLEGFSLAVEYDTNAISEIYVMDGDTYDQVDLNALEEGANVYIEASLNIGYEITGVTLDDENLDFRGNSMSFTMPSHDATLKIETTEIDIDGGLVKSEVGDGARVEIGTSVDDKGNLVAYPNYNPNTTIFPTGTKLYLKAYIINAYKGVSEIEKVTVNGNEVTLDSNGNAPFTVEDGGTTIVVTTKKVTYALKYEGDTSTTCTFYNENNEVITAAAVNDVVTAKFTNSNPSLSLYSVSLNGEVGNGTLQGNTYTFTVGAAEEITVRAEWADLSKEYSITYTTTPAAAQNVVDVKFFIDTQTQTPVTTAHPLDTVYISVGSNDQYSLETITLAGETEELESVTINDKEFYTFVMPNHSASLNLNFMELNGKHPIIIDTTALGSAFHEYWLYRGNTSNQVTLNDFFGTKGEKYYLDVWADGSFKVFGNGQELTTEIVGGIPYYTFVMPDATFTITFQLS